jgi:phage terminase small subunit
MAGKGRLSRMTPKQERFIQEYLVDGNATQAAARSGYSAKTSAKIGFENLQKPEIVAAIAKAQAARNQRVQVTQDYVLTRLMMEAERDGEGASHSARVAAVGLLGKHLVMFTDKTEHSGGITVNIPKADADL